MQWIAHNKILFAILVIVVIGAVWFGLSGSSAGPETTLLTSVSTTSGSPTQENADQQLVASLLALRSVSLSGTIFQDPAFQSLHDFGTAIVAEPVGRPNPFAPLPRSGGQGGASATTTTSRSGTAR